MADISAEAQTPLEEAEAALAGIQQQAQQVQRQHRDLQLLMRQIESEVQPLSGRKGERADAVRAIEANPSAYPPTHIRETYEALSDASIRLYMMQTQLDALRQRDTWLSGQVANLESYATTLERLVAALREQSTRAADVSLTSSPSKGNLPPAELARKVVEAREEASRQLAQRLQDGPVQVLTNVVLQAEVSQRLLARNPQRANDELSSLKANLARALGDARFFVSDLNPPALGEMGLRPILRRVVADLAGRTGRQIHIEYAGRDVRLGIEVETILYRLIREALAVALKCTQTSRINLLLTTQVDETEFRLTAAGPAASPAVGLDAMDEVRLYAQALGAGLEIAGPDEGGLSLALAVSAQAE